MPFTTSHFVTSGRFAYIRTLGRGAYGAVYLAQDTKLNRYVAVKEAIPNQEGFAQTQERFEKEARIQARFDHPHIIKVYTIETEVTTGEVYLFCEYANGGSLAEYLDKAGALPESAAVLLARDLCAALAAVTAQQIVHRDIKPANILLVTDAAGRIQCAKLGDFGIAQDPQERKTTVLVSGAAHPGTPPYMPPEQFNVINLLDVRSDLYALGITLWEALTLHDYKRLLALGTPQLQTYAPQTTLTMGNILRKAVQADKEKRYQSASEMEHALAVLRASVADKATIVQHARQARPSEPQWRYGLPTVVFVLFVLGMVFCRFVANGTARGVPSRTLVPPTATATPVPPSAPLRPTWLPEVVEVPAGPFLMGSSDSDTEANSNEKPQRTVELPTYWIGKTEVTNTQFRPFVAGDGYSNRAYWTDNGWAWRQQAKRIQPYYWADPHWNGDNYPVVGVTWYEAVAYCNWLSAQTGQDFRLPTEAEWEKAARGTDGHICPWGNTWAVGNANSAEIGLQGTAPVGAYPNDKSPYGALDMAGNVWEWMSSSFKSYPAGSNVAQKETFA